MDFATIIPILTAIIAVLTLLLPLLKELLAFFSQSEVE